MTFVKNDVKKIIKSTLEEILPLKVEANYGGDDFKDSSSEESFHIISGKKNDFSEVVKFWIKGFEKIIELDKSYESEIDYLEWFEADSSKCSKIHFQKEFGYMISRLKKKVELDSNSIRFYHIINEWNEQTFILEYKTELKLINWSTNT